MKRIFLLIISLPYLLSAQQVSNIQLNAKDTANQEYYLLLKAYKQGQKDYFVMPYLANTAKMLHNEDIANAIAHDYINNYLLRLKEDKLYTKENIEFIVAFLSSKDKSFDLFYKNNFQINIIKGVGYSQEVVDFVVAKEDIDPVLIAADKDGFLPDWNKIIKTITRKYNGNFADRIVLSAKLRWYEYKKSWPELVKYNVQKIEIYGLDTAGFMGKYHFNEILWKVIFMHSTDHVILSKAIKWMEVLLKAEPEQPSWLIDTYANLLYKIGRIRKAQAWEEKCLILEEENAKQNNSIPDKIYQETLQKMKRGKPTWLVE